MHLNTFCKPTFMSLLALATLLPTTTTAQQPATAVPKSSPALHELTTPALKAPGSLGAKAQLAAGYARLPLAFEPNVGQVDKRVRFLTHTGRGTLFLTNTEAVLTLSTSGNRSSNSLWAT